MNKSLFTIITFARINTKRFFRDRLSIFFGILFPLIFLFVFGGIFGQNSDVSFRVALINNSDSAFAKDFAKSLKKEKVFDIDAESKTLSAAKEKMIRSQLDAAIILPKDFGTVDAKSKRPMGQAKVYYTQNNEQAGQTLSSLLQASFKSINTKLTGSVDLFTVTGEKLKNKSLSQFDYTFAGLLGFSLLGIGIFGPVNVFPELKKQGILRRLSTTPLKVWQYFSSMAISQTIIGMVSLAVMFAVALSIFKLNMTGNPFELIGFLIVSIVLMLGIGLSIGGWAKNERQAAPLSNILVFPMMFLSGAFFPRFLMPEWLQDASAFLPLTPIIDGIRLIITENAHYVDLLPQLGIMGAWLVIIYIIAFRVFRWE
ncbi:MAG TPA: ABC transporter permease [Candidatus Saccharibacteria bacterium]|nr:ABC transporter permease [Candidatus Saccharibacteria bacterium]